MAFDNRAGAVGRARRGGSRWGGQLDSTFVALAVLIAVLFGLLITLREVQPSGVTAGVVAGGVMLLIVLVVPIGVATGWRLVRARLPRPPTWAGRGEDRSRD